MKKSMHHLKKKIDGHHKKLKDHHAKHQKLMHELNEAMKDIKAHFKEDESFRNGRKG